MTSPTAIIDVKLEKIDNLLDCLEEQLSKYSKPLVHVVKPIRRKANRKNSLSKSRTA